MKSIWKQRHPPENANVSTAKCLVYNGQIDILLYRKDAHVKGKHEYQCLFKKCGKTSKNRSFINRHIRQHFTYICNRCSETFPSISQRNSHMKIMHPVPVIISPSKVPTPPSVVDNNNIISLLSSDEDKEINNDHPTPNKLIMNQPTPNKPIDIISTLLFCSNNNITSLLSEKCSNPEVPHRNNACSSIKEQERQIAIKQQFYERLLMENKKIDHDIRTLEINNLLLKKQYFELCKEYNIHKLCIQNITQQIDIQKSEIKKMYLPRKNIPYVGVIKFVNESPQKNDTSHG